MKLENSKGTRDFGPEDKILRNEVVDKLKVVFERYGYSPIETPIIEKLEVLTAKYAAGEESDAAAEIFKLKDQGERKLGLRFDLTVPFARFIGMSPELKMPFKRYQIEPVFRDGPIKLGRYRQFWQCDVDIVGSKEMLIDAEMIALALDAFREIGLDAFLEVNNRKILKGIILFAGIKEELADEVIISIDKLAKIGESGVTKELESKGISDDKIAKLMSAFKVSGDVDEKITVLRSIISAGIGKEGLDELEAVFSYLSSEQKKNVVFSVSLARGLGYYTGTIFEGFMRESEITSSICGGGRYDNLIPMLLGKKDEESPAIGISFGLDVITDVLTLARKSAAEGYSPKKTVVQAFVIPIKTQKECFEICRKMRNSGISADLDFLSRGISKNLAYANSLGIPYAIIVGGKELEQGKVKLRDMLSGAEELLVLDDAISKIKAKA